MRPWHITGLALSPIFPPILLFIIGDWIGALGESAERAIGSPRPKARPIDWDAVERRRQ